MCDACNRYCRPFQWIWSENADGSGIMHKSGASLLSGASIMEAFMREHPAALAGCVGCCCRSV